jgi:hypothetical protein
MAFGSYNPFFYWFKNVPGINMLHYPVKYLFLAGFSLSLLSGMGFSSFFATLEHRKEIKGLTVGLLTANLVFITVLFVGFFTEGTLFTLFKNIYPQTLFHKIVGVESSFLAMFKGYSWFVILFTIVSVLIVLTMRGKIALRGAKVILIVIILADLIFLGKPKDNTIESSLYTRPNEVVKILKSDPAQYRIFSLSYITFGGAFMNIPNTPFAETFKTLQSFMMPNLSAIFRIDSINEYAAILVKRYYMLFSPVKEFFRLEEKESWQRNYCKEILNLLNVKYVISSFSIEDKDFKLIQGGPVKLYENLGVLPRVYLVPQAIKLEDDEEVLKAIQEVNFNPRESILLTREEYEKARIDFIDEASLSLDSFKGEVKILKYSPNHVDIETVGNDSSFLVLADNFYPGWKVYVNGSNKNILRVNYNLRGVVVPPGKNSVSFRFAPLSFKIGGLIAFLTLLGIGAFFVVEKRGKKA